MTSIRACFVILVAATAFITHPAQMAKADDLSVAKQSIDDHFDTLFANFVEATYVTYCTAIFYGEVLSVETEPYSTVPTDSSPLQWHVGTRITLSVKQSWKHPMSGTVELWTHGGILPESFTTDSDPWPRGCGSGNDAMFLVGQTVYVAVAEEHPLRPYPIWTVGGQTGVIPSNIAETGPGDALGPTTLTPEINDYFQVKTAEFYSLLNDFLSSIEK